MGQARLQTITPGSRQRHVVRVIHVVDPRVKQALRVSHLHTGNPNVLSCPAIREKIGMHQFKKELSSRMSTYTRHPIQAVTVYSSFCPSQPTTCQMDCILCPASLKTFFTLFTAFGVSNFSFFKIDTACDRAFCE